MKNVNSCSTRKHQQQQQDTSGSHCRNSDHSPSVTSWLERGLHHCFLSPIGRPCIKRFKVGLHSQQLTIRTMLRHTICPSMWRVSLVTNTTEACLSFHGNWILMSMLPMVNHNDLSLSKQWCLLYREWQECTVPQPQIQIKNVKNCL